MFILYFCFYGITDLVSIYSLNILFNKHVNFISEKVLRLLGFIIFNLNDSSKIIDILLTYLVKLYL